MATSSSSFAQACEHVKTWVEGIIEASADIGPPGAAASGAGVRIAPWRIAEPRRRRDGGAERLAATGYFCVSVGPKSPACGCTWIDALYFAAFDSTEVALATSEPPDSYWSGAPGLHVTLTRRIERPVEALRPGRVQHPLVFEVRPGLDAEADPIPRRARRR